MHFWYWLNNWWQRIGEWPSDREWKRRCEKYRLKEWQDLIRDFGGES